jgi:hypothetical protein
MDEDDIMFESIKIMTWGFTTTIVRVYKDLAPSPQDDEDNDEKIVIEKLVFFQKL